MHCAPGSLSEPSGLMHGGFSLSPSVICQMGSLLPLLHINWEGIHSRRDQGIQG